MPAQPNIYLEPLDDDRVAPRLSVHLPALLTLASGVGVAVTMRNLSPRGFRVMLPAGSAAPGDRLGLRMLLGPARRCDVIWVRDGEAGCEWCEEVSLLALLGEPA